MGRFKKFISYIAVLMARRKINKRMVENRINELDKMVKDNPELKILVDHYKESIKNEKA